jgi:hypothetical protein
MSIAISDLRAIGDALGRFANIRETAKEPEDRILILDDGEVTKFVAGSTVRAIVHLGPTFGGGRALVSARLLLGAVKALRGKGEVSLTYDGIGGATLTTSAGGKVVPRPCLRAPRWTSQPCCLPGRCRCWPRWLAR